MDDAKKRVHRVIPLRPEHYRVDKVEGDGENWTANVSAKLCSTSDIESFIRGYMDITCETLKTRVQKPAGSARGKYVANEFYRCHHDTRYEKTRDIIAIKTTNPLKRVKNTYCPMSMTFKITKEEFADEYPCQITIEHTHNHPTKSLEVFSYKTLTEEVIGKVDSLFESGCTPSSAYREYLCVLRKICRDELEFHLKKADRSITPRRRDFNYLYKKYCLACFGGKDSAEMFEMLASKIEEFTQKEPDTRINYQVYNTEEESPFILAIVTPLMQRVHTMVSFSS